MAVDRVVIHGYQFRYVPGEHSANGQIVNYTLSADPISPAAGMRHFYLDQTTVIRYENGAPADGASSAIP
jgi:hypothetical protein